MDQQLGEEFLQRLMDDPSLRAQFERDPTGTLARAGLDVPEEDVQALRAIDWQGASDQELAERISKVGVSSW